MKDLEKAIDQAAKINAGLDKDLQIDYDERYYQSHKCNLYEKFINGAKSPAAKEYWQQDLLTKEQVQDLIIKLYKSNLPYSDKIKWDVAIISEDNVRDFINKEVMKK